MFLFHPNRKWIGGFMIAVACACLVVMIVSFAYEYHFIRNAQSAGGRIVRIEKRDQRGNTYCRFHSKMSDCELPVASDFKNWQLTTDN